MTGIMDPLEVADALRASYLRYLETSFYLKDPSLRKQFSRLLQDETQPPVRQPILEISPGFKSGKSLRDLISDGLFSSDFRHIGTEVLERPLYIHQETALRKAIAEKRNFIVATGAGSGKTETFLYPILNHLLREKESGTLNEPGIRALLLYPMNALANDQIARLRKLAKEFPDITFGRYTGETEQEWQKALGIYRRSFYEEDPLENELICRNQMQVNPPHILFTNYAMLEYLMIRPKDSKLFEGDKWRFVVLDEVHTYSGALGVEIAMLLRRLKERVVRSEVGRLQCIATSATLGGGEEDYPKIADFATSLFGEKFEANSIIGAQYQQLQSGPKPWGKGTKELYGSLRELVFSGNEINFDNIVDVAKSQLSKVALDNALASLPSTLNGKEKCQAFFYALLEGDAQVQRLRSQLDKKHALELDSIKDIDGVVDLVALGAYARKPGNPIPLIPARYHIMARAISGIYVWIDSTGKLQLLSKRYRRYSTNDGQECAVFELASCNRCGEVLLVGVIENDGGHTCLRQPPGVGDDPSVDLHWFALYSGTSDSKVDEDDAADEQEEFKRVPSTRPEPKRLCRICGRIDDTSTFNNNDCKGHKSDVIDLCRIKNKLKRPWPRKCPSCGNIHGTVASRVLTGKEAPVAVISTSLYQKIPATSEGGKASLPGGGRKLMMFSDSRQDAAFFAPFMDNTYNKFKQRRYLVQALEKAGEPLDLEDWARQTRVMAECAGEWEEETGPGRRKRETAGWVLREWIATDRRLALEGAGVAIFHLRKPTAFTELPLLSSVPWNLDRDAQWLLIQVLLDTIRYQGIVSFGEFGLEHSDAIFKPRNVDCYLRGASSKPKKRVYAWEPAENRTNKRLDYLERLLWRKGVSEAQAPALAVLKEIWQMINLPNAPLAKLFECGLSHQYESNLFRLKPKWWQVSLAGNDDIFHCDTCGTVTAFVVESTCPMSGCRGKVIPYSQQERCRNHYHSLFTNMKPIPLSVREHTAQLTKKEAAQIQQDFIMGKVNMLSCTTTFELGVDVGDLQSVFMRNIPPNPGNYVQRAGRAGRRADSAAVIVSYAQRRTHDLAYFEQPIRLILGSIRPPAVHLNNAKIVRRHVHAEALAEYFRENPDVFVNRLESLFDPESHRPDELLDFLSNHPPQIKERLERIIPSELHAVLGLEEWGWLDGHGMGDEDKRETFAERLRNATEDVHGDWQALTQAEESASQNKNHKGAAIFAQQLRTLKKRSLIGKLGTYGLMPKYGFPTEVVELKIRSSDRKAGQVELERDMKLALSEFAPGNQIVANGRVWTSQGIVLPTGERKLHEFRYWHCSTCQYFTVERIVATDDTTDEIRICHCGKSIPANKYIYPEFGFTTAAIQGVRVGEKRPGMKSYSDVYFHETGDEVAFVPLPDFPKISCRESNQGWIHVINDNRDKGFFLCKSCGYMTGNNPHFDPDEGKTHSKPWASDQRCASKNKFMRKIALGYRYRTDVLELCCPGENIEGLQLQNFEDHHSLWLSVLYALINGACRALDIGERDLGGCLYYSSKEHPLLILFDTAPGGAGFVQDIRKHFREVLEEALKLLDCHSCAKDSSCIACLQTYFNQRDHNRLIRGRALEYLGLIAS